jgi:hypothetical protein
MQNTLSDSLLAAAPESHVLVFPGTPSLDGDALAAAWKAARDEALSAYNAWRDGDGLLENFAVYRAAADREEAAAAALSNRASEGRTRWYRLLKGDSPR